MNKEQKELIQSLLSNANVETQEGLARLQRHDDNPEYEHLYQQKIKLIEETYKEVEKL